MANDFAWKISGLGTVKLLLENENILFLKETIYVPNLKKELSVLRYDR